MTILDSNLLFWVTLYYNLSILSFCRIAACDVVNIVGEAFFLPLVDVC